jgi:hypothetical protein
MRNTKIFCLAFFCLLFSIAGKSIAQQSKAVLYMEKIGAEMKSIQEDSWEYTRQAAHGRSARKVEVKRKELINTSKLAMGRVSGMPAFEGNTQFRDSVASFLNIHYLVLKEDFGKIVNMEEVAEQSYDAMEAYMLAKELASNKLEQAGDMVEKQYQLFADNNNIKLLDEQSKLTKKLAKSSSVYKYYNEVYLIFFKSYKQEAYYMQALNAKDLNAMEQNKNALKSTSEEGLAKLKGMNSYDGDGTLLSAAKNVLEFYKTESTTKLDLLSDYILNEDKFQKILKTIDTKPQSSRTNEDIRKYNETVKDLNNRANNFNKLNQELNILRSKAIDLWNNQSDRFIDNQIPRSR